MESVETLSPDLAFPQPWPPGTVLTLVFGDPPGPTVSWVATIDSHVVSWNVQSDAVAAVIGSGRLSVRLWYENGTVRVPLAVGEAQVYG